MMMTMMMMVTFHLMIVSFLGVAINIRKFRVEYPCVGNVIVLSKQPTFI